MTLLLLLLLLLLFFLFNFFQICPVLWKFILWQNIFTSLQTWNDLIEIYIYCWQKNILRCHIIEIATLKYISYSIYINICQPLTGLCIGKIFFLISNFYFKLEITWLKFIFLVGGKIFYAFIWLKSQHWNIDLIANT